MFLIFLEIKGRTYRQNFWLLYSAKLNIHDRDLTGGFRPQNGLYTVNGASEAHEREQDNIFVSLHDTEVEQNHR